MSLQLWLPFNGDIHNQGLSDVKLFGSINPISDGKLGICAHFSNDPSAKVYADTNIFNYTGSFSFCTWIRRDNVSTYPQCVFSVSGNYGITIQEDNKIRPWCKSIQYPKSCPHGEWHHIAFTASGNEFKIYLDGELSTLVSESSPTADSYKNSRITIGCDSSAVDGDAYPFYGSLNDFRLYDHCLSSKEVAEIAKGLILHYKLDYMGFDKTEEPDCSGFGNNGTMVGAFTYDSDTPRYSSSTVFNGTDTYIAAGTGAKVKDAITVSIWAYMDDWHNDGDVNKIRPISCTQLGGWVIEGKTNGKIAFSVYTGTDSNAYKVAYSTITRASMASGWHHFVGTYDGFNVKFYIDGVLQSTNAAYTTKTPIYYNSSNGIFIGDEAAGSATTPETSSTHNFNGKISDVRIYATALTPDQVKELYNSPYSIDNNGNLFCYQIEERSKASVSKYGIWYDKCFSGSIVNQYDPITYVEPDGSIWIRIFHHNDPANRGLFSSTNSFATSVYLDDDRWFNVSLCNYLTSKWELMIKQKLLNTNNETKYRWIQNYNPMTATYEQVTVDNVTKVTTDGYSTNTAYGGLHKHSAATYICASNASSTQWFGAVGCYALYNSGIAAYGGGAITTGFMDLYLRVDNIETPNFRINAGGTMATDFYEI